LTWCRILTWLIVQDYPTLYIAKDKIPLDDRALQASVQDKVSKIRNGLTAAEVSCCPERHCGRF
jgi:hypothetical protein